MTKLRTAVTQMRAAHPEIEEVWLFGSLARDQAVPGSDADLLPILTATSEDFLSRIPHYLPQGLPLGVDVFPYTRAEIETALEAGNPLIQQALTEGILLL